MDKIDKNLAEIEARRREFKIWDSQVLWMIETIRDLRKQLKGVGVEEFYGLQYAHSKVVAELDETKQHLEKDCAALFDLYQEKERLREAMRLVIEDHRTTTWTRTALSAALAPHEPQTPVAELCGCNEKWRCYKHAQSGEWCVPPQPRPAAPQPAAGGVTDTQRLDWLENKGVKIGKEGWARIYRSEIDYAMREKP